MDSPEERARINIDRLLAAAGWEVQDRRRVNLGAAMGVAVREFPLATGEADYLLFVQRKAIGGVEAKPEGATLSGVEMQSGKYAIGLPAQVPAWRRPLPFLYESTGGFLLAGHDYIKGHYTLDREQWDHLRHRALHGWEIVDSAARLCVMNLYLHGIGANGGSSPIHVADSLAADPGDRFDIVMTNPPFGKKSSVTFINEEGEAKRESQVIVRDDFWTSTSNKQLNFVQHIKTILKINGRAAVVVPDNVLFEGGAGETVRRKLLHECDVHTLLRLPTGIFYAQGVKANVLFFDRKPASEKPWTKQLWIYDLRTNRDFSLKQNPLTRGDLDEFVACYHPENRHERKPTWSDAEPQGRWRAYGIDELMARDKVNLDIFWLRDESLEDSANLPEPDVLAAEIVEVLQAALEQFAAIAEDLGE